MLAPTLGSVQQARAAVPPACCVQRAAMGAGIMMTAFLNVRFIQGNAGGVYSGSAVLLSKCSKQSPREEVAAQVRSICKQRFAAIGSCNV